jgi:hypothetical protein
MARTNSSSPDTSTFIFFSERGEFVNHILEPQMLCVPWVLSRAKIEFVEAETSDLADIDGLDPELEHAK